MTKKRFLFSMVFILILTLGSCTKKDQNEVPANGIISSIETETDTVNSGLKVTFIEMGSVNCMPCRMMTPVMDKVRENFQGQVEVVFYDVWTTADAPMAQRYRIRVIPTQVFLDADGIEYFRHEGFFPYEEIVLILKQKGVEPL